MAQPFFRAGARVVDVGCNVGLFTKVALAAGCHVHAFDADPRIQTKWPHPVPVDHYAVGAETRSDVPVYSRDKTTETSLYRDAVLDDKAIEIGRVPMRRLDDLVHGADLIKVDVQGAESDVLTGAPRLLETCPAWIIECWPHGLTQAGSSAQRLWTQFTDAGLTVTWAGGPVVQRLDVDGWTRTAKRTSHVNWLATR